MSDKKKITEKSGEHNKWYEEASKQTLESLPEFLSHLANNYVHDYGTICHAVAASALAAAYAMNASPAGGITGFQAGCIMWEFIQKWMNYKSPLKLIDYGNMLYPQYKNKFDKTISKETWEYLQKEASKLLAESNEITSPNVINHWKAITEGVIPFGYRLED
jgi:hypothetical protein